MPRLFSLRSVVHANWWALLFVFILPNGQAGAQGPGWLDDQDVEKAAVQGTPRREPQPIRRGGFVQQLRSLSEGIFGAKDAGNNSAKGNRQGAPSSPTQNPWSRAAERARQNPEQVQRFTDSDLASGEPGLEAEAREVGPPRPPQPQGIYLLDDKARSRPWTPQNSIPAQRSSTNGGSNVSDNSESSRPSTRASGPAARFESASKARVSPKVDVEPKPSLDPPEVRISEFNSKKQARPISAPKKVDSSSDGDRNLSAKTRSNDSQPKSDAKQESGPEQAPKVARKIPPKRPSPTAESGNQAPSPPSSTKRPATAEQSKAVTTVTQPRLDARSTPNPSPSGNPSAATGSNLTSSGPALPSIGSAPSGLGTAKPEVPGGRSGLADARTTGTLVGSMLPSLSTQSQTAQLPALPSSPALADNPPQSASRMKVSSSGQPSGGLQDSSRPHAPQETHASQENSAVASNGARRPAPTGPVPSGVQSPRGLLNMEIPHVAVQMLGPSDMQAGAPADYQIVIHNQDRIGVSGVLLSLDVPASVAIERLPSNQGEVRLEKSDDNSNVLTWILPEMSANTMAKLPIRLTARDARNFAVAMEWTIVPQAGNKQIEVRQAQLRLALEGPSEVEYGVPHVYRLRVSNPGNAPAKNVVVHLTSDPNGSSSSDIGDIGPGQEQIVDVELTFQQRGTVRIAADATSGPNLCTQSNIEVQVRQAALTAAVVTSPVALYGSPTPSEARITNAGDAEAKNVKATIALPAGCSFASTPQGATVKGSELIWTVPRLAVGETATCQFQFTSTKPGVQSMSLACVGPAGIQARSEASFEVEAVADLKLVVNDPTAPAPVNSEVVYELTVTNRGSRDASSVKILAQFSDGIEPMRAEGAQHRIVPGQVLFEPIHSIQPGQSLQMKVVAKAVQDGNHRFRAEVRCDENETRLVHELSTRFLDSVRRVASPPNSALYR